MLSGQPQDLVMTKSFHGTVIAWARQAGLFKIENSLADLDTNTDVYLDMTWRSWAQAEESVRLVLGLYVHDGEFATSFHHEPLLRYAHEMIPICCSEELFTASSAAQWHTSIRLQRGSQLVPSSSIPSQLRDRERKKWASQMCLYASLSGIVASIQEAKTSFVSHASVQHFRDVLLTWYKDKHKAVAQPKHSPISLMVLWHTAFMCLYANFDILERAIGRDGSLPSEEATSEVRAWVSSPEARYGVLHAFLVLKQLETLPVDVEPAIHVPKALFYSAIAIHCYTQLGRTANSSIPSHDENNMPEFLIAGSAFLSQQSSSNLWPKSGSPSDKSTLCSIIDLLRRTGHWGISQRYACILENLVDDLTDS
ncbi:hypothetical protein BKA63DRAFT_279767 [Paraphoma chrysanthemicola]|nr:hypothetical protein BKA63DRAFT_279767 [Paraphoma chrysanthemicola]